MPDLTIGNKWKYFKQREFECKCGCGLNNIHDELVRKLDELRGFYGEPLIIVSGCRCEIHNLLVRGEKSSSHLDGWAVDLRINGGLERFKLINLILHYNIFQRIGIGKNFIHLDIDCNKPQNVIWTY